MKSLVPGLFALYDVVNTKRISRSRSRSGLFKLHGLAPLEPIPHSPGLGALKSLVGLEF